MGDLIDLILIISGLMFDVGIPPDQRRNECYLRGWCPLADIIDANLVACPMYTEPATENRALPIHHRAQTVREMCNIKIAYRNNNIKAAKYRAIIRIL